MIKSYLTRRALLVGGMSLAAAPAMASQRPQIDAKVAALIADISPAYRKPDFERVMPFVFREKVPTDDGYIDWYDGHKAEATYAYAETYVAEPLQLRRLFFSAVFRNDPPESNPNTVGRVTTFARREGWKRDLLSHEFHGMAGKDLIVARFRRGGVTMYCETFVPPPPLHAAPWPKPEKTRRSPTNDVALDDIYFITEL